CLHLEASTVLNSHSSPTSVLASILHLTIASLPSSPSTADPVPSSSNHQPPTTGYGDHSSSFLSLPCSRSRFFSVKHPQVCSASVCLLWLFSVLG
ncbi:unnamed protein product, partial [Prunus brigantina]